MERGRRRGMVRSCPVGIFPTPTHHPPEGLFSDMIQFLHVKCGGIDSLLFASSNEIFVINTHAADIQIRELFLRNRLTPRTSSAVSF
jgi:hypothetical protein